MTTATIPIEQIAALLTQMKLTTAAELMTDRLVAAGLDQALPVVAEVLMAEQEARRERRVTRLRRASNLPPGKTFDTWQDAHLSRKLVHSIRELAGGTFADRGANVLAFGLPGTGKTHALCAIGHALVASGRSVYFTPTFRLVQQLLAAKRDLELTRLLRKLDSFDVLICDDLGYIKQNAEEAEVLFTLMAERYERRSMMLTSNLVFSKWDQIFRNPMATAAAIDRLVHHSVILEFDGPSYRTNGHKRRNAAGAQS